MSQFLNITEYPNTFKRQGSFPLDSSSIFYNLEEAIEYAKSSLAAYNGQIISVIDNEDVNIYTLKPSNENDVRYELAQIYSSAYDLVNSKMGWWNISNKPNSSDAVLDFDILYSNEADSYEVFFNDNSVSDILSLSDEFITDLNNFKNDSIVITLKFYRNNLPAFKLKAKAMYKNSVVILGDLYLIELFDTTVFQI